MAYSLKTNISNKYLIEFSYSHIFSCKAYVTWMWNWLSLEWACMWDLLGPWQHEFQGQRTETGAGSLRMVITDSATTADPWESALFLGVASNTGNWVLISKGVNIRWVRVHLYENKRRNNIMPIRRWQDYLYRNPMESKIKLLEFISELIKDTM